VDLRLACQLIRPWFNSTVLSLEVKPRKGKGKEKKEKKIPKKFLGVTFDGVNVYHKPREELEYICETIRSQIDKERGERIKFQMERDLFAELNSLYTLRLKELKVGWDADAEEDRVIFKLIVNQLFP